MVPEGLSQEIETKWSKHLPRPQKKIFLQLILRMGMDAYEGEQELTAPFVGREENDPKLLRFHHYIDAALVERFNRLHQAHEPPSTTRGFFELVLNLGLQVYEREYTIYGFKRD
jgi:hypothetical protein